MTSREFPMSVEEENEINEFESFGSPTSFATASSSTDATSHLKRHPHSCLTKRGNQLDIRTQMQLGKDTKGKLTCFNYDQSVARREIVEYMVRAEFPFTFVENHDFTGMIQRGLNPQYGGFSATTAKRDVMKHFNQYRSSLISYFQKFKGKICLTSSLWTSKSHMAFLCLTAHWIDEEWRLNKKIISFKMIETPHTGITIANVIHDELVAWGISKKILSITLDNASDNDVAEKTLRALLDVPVGSVLYDLFHVRCCAHILNLVMQDGLSLLNSSVEKIKNIVRNINSSLSRYELYKKCLKHHGMRRKNITLDNPIRWNSTYELLKQAVTYKNILHYYTLQIQGAANIESPTEQDWLVAEIVRDFFEVFDSSTNFFCCVYHPSVCRVVIQLVNIVLTFQNYYVLDRFQDALSSMKSKFDKYFGTLPLIYCFAIVLDPRLKMDALEQWLRVIYLTDDEIAETISLTRSKLVGLFNYYKTQVGGGMDRIPTTQTSLLATSSLCGGAMSILKKARLTQNVSTVSGAQSELSRYLSHPTCELDDEDESFDILSWWRSQEPRYPILTIMARDILTVPVSTVASEAAFSADGRVISEKRSSLSPDTMEALICLKDWQLAEKRLQQAEQEKELQELMENLRISRPSWIEDSDSEPEIEPVD